MEDMDHLGYCGVDCSVCPDCLQGKCPGCRRTVWPEGDPCPPVSCCEKRGIACCGLCGDFPCGMMEGFYRESEGHRLAFRRMQALRDGYGEPRFPAGSGDGSRA